MELKQTENTIGVMIRFLMKKQILLWFIAIDLIAMFMFKNNRYLVEKPNDGNYELSLVEATDMNSNSTLIYLYNSAFTELFNEIYHDCEVEITFQLNHDTAPKLSNQRIQHMPDYLFFTQLRDINISIASDIKEFESYSSAKEIIFVVPIWNDILSVMYSNDRELCFKQHLNHTKYRNLGRMARKHLVDDVAQELSTKISEFEEYIKSHPSISYKYITMLHCWFYKGIWSKIVQPLYVNKNMFIIHYERNVVERWFGKSFLYEYKRIIIAPYMSPLFLLPSDDTNGDENIMNNVYFSGGIRRKMSGGMLRIKACELNEIEGVQINYVISTELKSEILKEMSLDYNLSYVQYKKVKKCILNNSARKKHENNVFNDRIYFNDLKKSRFCLFFRGDSFGARRFYDIIAAECIPVIVSDKWLKYAAPFKSVIDYHQMCYFIKEKAFEQDPAGEINKILQVDSAEYNFKLRYVQKYKKHLIWYTNYSTVTQNIFLSL